MMRAAKAQTENFWICQLITATSYEIYFPMKYIFFLISLTFLEFPRLSTKFQISLTNSKIHWLFPVVEFPWLYPDQWQPWHSFPFYYPRQNLIFRTILAHLYLEYESAWVGYRNIRIIFSIGVHNNSWKLISDLHTFDKLFFMKAGNELLHRNVCHSVLSRKNWAFKIIGIEQCHILCTQRESHNWLQNNQPSTASTSVIII